MTAMRWLVLSALLLVLAGCSQANQPILVDRMTDGAGSRLPEIEEADGPSNAKVFTSSIVMTPVVPVTSTLMIEETQAESMLAFEPASPYLSSLAKRDPNLIELQAFLETVPTRLLDGENHSTLVDGYFADHPLSGVAKITFQDLNGDGEDDLIVSDLISFGWGQGSMTILLWDGTGYSDPAMLVGFSKYTSLHRVTFDDWTGDGLPEVVYDFASDTGGTGILEQTHTRRIVHCGQTCELVWSQLLGRKTTDYSVGRTNVETNRYIDQDARSVVTVATDAFHAPSLLPIISSGHLDVFTSTWSSYVWNGIVFEKEEDLVTALPTQIEAQSQLFSESSTGANARLLSVINKSVHTRPIYDCQLYINETAIGDPVSCDPNFTRIEWLDLTGDGQDEIVIIAVAFATQRLLAYEWTGDNSTHLIADVTGDIIRPDLFGVRIADLDGDGIPEIVTGVDGVGEPTYCQQEENPYDDDPPTIDVCWYDWILGEITYRWDGSRFAEWHPEGS